MEAVAAAALVVVCCNGGTPYVDLHVFPPSAPGRIDLSRVQRWPAADLTDWVASDTALDQLLPKEAGVEWSSNATERRNDSQFVAVGVPSWLSSALSAGADPSTCDAFNLTFATAQLRAVYASRHGRLGCKCPPAFGGKHCQVLPVGRPSEDLVRQYWWQFGRALPLHETSGSGPSAVSDDRHAVQLAGATGRLALVALVPLAFALFAIMGALACKMACIDLPACVEVCCTARNETATDPEAVTVKAPSRNKIQNDGRSSRRRSSDEPLDPITVQRCLDRARAYRENGCCANIATCSTSGGRRPVPSAPAAGSSGAAAAPLLATVTDGCQPVDFYPGPSPPPSYKCSPPPSYKSGSSSPHLADGQRRADHFFA